MEFSPHNPIVKRCIQGMEMEDKGRAEHAAGLYRQAWEKTTNDFERFIVAYCIARNREDTEEKLAWLTTTLNLALHIDNECVRPAYAMLHFKIAECYKALNDLANTQMNIALANTRTTLPTDVGPFYHGTKAALKAGEELTAGNHSNYKTALRMNHIYFTAIPAGAELAASLANGPGPGRVYLVEPTGVFEDDPNVTNKKFPGNPTRSYRSRLPLKIRAEITDWQRLTAAEIQQWHERLKKNKGDIIN